MLAEPAGVDNVDHTAGRDGPASAGAEAQDTDSFRVDWVELLNVVKGGSGVVE